jgi:hypothetical protein
MKAALFLTSVLLLCATTFATERFITTDDGVKLFVKVSGRGEPCLFVQTVKVIPRWPYAVLRQHRKFRERYYRFSQGLVWGLFTGYFRSLLEEP